MTFARRHLGLLIFVTSVLTAAGLAGAAPPPPPDDLDRLLAAYRAHGLPLPPADAQLVRIGGGEWARDGGPMEPFYHLGFVVTPAAGGRPPVLLVGTEEFRPDGEEFGPVEPKAVKANQIMAEWNATFGINAALAVAIQCKARGWDDLAKRLLAASLTEGVGHPHSFLYQPAGLSPADALSHLAWVHWFNAIVRPGTDRAAIAARMRALLAADPRLDLEANHILLRALEAALVPGRGAPGSVEALIDDLVELDDGAPGEPYAINLRYLKVSLRGFEAVPALIEHLDDDRLTRSVKQAFGNFPTWPKRVGDVVTELLQEIAGDDLGKDWLERQQASRVEKEAARAWWATARETGEEAYAVAHVLPALTKDGLPADPEAKSPNAALLRIVAARYPARLPEVYKAVLDRKPPLQSRSAARAIAASGMPRERKLALLLLGANHANLAHRADAFWELKDLDAEAFVALLVRTLDDLPATPAEPYWICPEATFAQYVMETDDPRAWAALARAARRADAGLRLGLMRPMDYTDRFQRQRVEFLAGFLDDATVRDVASDPKRFVGPHAGSRQPRLAVRDFAAEKLALVFKWPEDPLPPSGRTAEQWAALRARAKEAAARELHGPAASQPTK